MEEDLRQEILALAARHKALGLSGRRHRLLRPKDRMSADLSVCERKEPMTKEYADLVVERIRRHQHARVQAYKCKFCGHWHVGSTLQPRQF